MDKVWLVPPDGGEPEEVEATPEILVPRMVQGWRQVQPPSEVNDNAR
jgi:hypothetical protein